jgi:hypothetical protein
MVAMVVGWGAQAAAQPLDMRTRVSALGYVPFVWVTLTEEGMKSVLEADAGVVVSRVYAGPREGARELGVIVARHVDDLPGPLPKGVELVCRMQGETGRSRWLGISDEESEHGVNALVMDYRPRPPGRPDRETNGFYPKWVQLPPTACGLPVWWPMETTDLRGNYERAAGDLYVLPAVHGVIAYTGRSVTLDPEGVYRILRMHDGVIELRRQIGLDLEPREEDVFGPAEAREEFRQEREFLRQELIPPTIRIRISDVIDADGRLRLSVAYADPC